MKLLLLLASLVFLTRACTNYLITKGASSSNSSFLTYNADSADLYGELYHHDGATWPAGTMVDIYDWDSGEYLGKIAQAPQTYTTNGNMNEFQLAITETTFGGAEELQSQKGAILDYGSLIYITLQRAKTAREAIQVMTSLVQQYGYYSEGESFSLSDPNEMWVLEMIGKGNFELGAVWVAVRIPDGMVTAHANQARIRTFSMNDPQNVMFASDVVTFAQKIGLYSNSGLPKDFSFSDTYDEVTFGGARFCEGRVWSFFNRITTGMDAYLDYAQGYNLTNRMPLWVKPNVDIGVKDLMDWMGDHFEGTWLDFSKDVGAGSFNAPYRWRPLTWDLGGQTYVNERSAGTQQTAFTLVAQTRSWLPDPIGGVLWFGVDDADSAVYLPVYCGVTRVPSTYKQGNGDLMTFTFNSAFWVAQLVTNFAYTRYNTIHPEVRAKINTYHQQYVTEMVTVDATAKSLAQTSLSSAVEYVTQYTESSGNRLTQEWLSFWQYLFVKYLDGNVKSASTNPAIPAPIVEAPGYGEDWEQRIVDETGTHYLQPTSLSSTHDLAKDRKLRQLKNIL